MANYATLIAAIQSVITQNGNNEITGPILQQTLISVVNSLGSGYQFIGIATPETTPGTPDQKVFYIGASGTYPNFGPAVIPDGNLAVFYYDSSWHYGSVAFPLGDNAVTTNKIADGAITIDKFSTELKNLLFRAGFKYLGVATTSTVPGTPTENVFYLASPGTYDNFGFTVDNGTIGVFKYDGTNWAFDNVAISAESRTEINIGNYSNSRCCLGNRTSGWYNYNNLMYHKAIPVSPGDKYYLTLLTMSTGGNGAYYGLLTGSYTPNPTIGSTIPFVGDTDRIYTLVATPTVVTIPNNCAFLAINMVDGSVSTNTWKLEKIGSSLFGTLSEIEAEISTINDEITAIQQQLERGAVEQPMDASLFLEIPGYVGTDGKCVFPSSPTSYGTIVSAGDLIGKTITFKNDSAKMVRYAFLTGLSTSSNNFCAGTSLVTLKDSLGDSATIPNGCKYIYVFKVSVGNNVFPDHIFISSSTTEILNRLDEINAQIGPGDFKAFDVVSSTSLGTLSSASGYVMPDGTWYRVTSTGWYGAFIDATPYRGKRIRFIKNANKDYTRYAFVVENLTGLATTKYPIFCRGASLVSIYAPENPIAFVPLDCNYIYVMVVSNSERVQPQRIEIIEEHTITKILNDNADSMRKYERRNYDVAKIFNYYFPGMSPVPETLAGVENATINENGLSLPAGFGYHITHNKVFVFDEEKITLEISATASDIILCYSTSNASGTISNAQVNSFIRFNFVNGRISIYQAGTINTSTGAGTELVGIDFTPGAGNYIVTFGRKNRAPFGAIYNKGTREYVELTFAERDYDSVNEAQRPAGWLYHYPAFSVLSGSPVFKRFAATAPTDLFMLFQGDSYTQGYAGRYYNCWAKMAADYFGNSLPAGISGGTLDDIIRQYHDCIKGKIKTKYIVISIGINDMSSLSTDAAINTWAGKFLDYVNELISDGITPIINRIWPEGSTTSATATKATKMNNKIRSFGYDGADFGAVVGYSNNADYYVSSHLSIAGNKLTYDIFIRELTNYYVEK